MCAPFFIIIDKIYIKIPIFKNESRVACNNYRLISLLSNIVKIIEKLMHKRLHIFLETQNCFYPAQFGFRLNVSTSNALMSITKNIQTQLDEGKYCAEVFVDLRKAFDTVNHYILLRKVDYYGIRGIANEWFCSYLKKRKQFVSIEINMSSVKEILTGVPQGSVLGPLLFLIYVNDLKSLNVKKKELFIFRPRKLKIGHSFKLDGKRLVPTHFVKYLGALIDEHLLWNKQIVQIKIRLNRAIGMLSKL